MITNTASKVTYTGDGATKKFQVTFPFIATTDLQLFLRTIATGEYEEIDSNWSYDDGYITYPVTGSAIADTKQIIIQRNTPLTQEKDHDVRLFASEDIEGMADKLTQITQELRRDIEEVSSPESIDIDIAQAIGQHNTHPQAHYDLFANKVVKTGDTMTGDLTMAKNDSGVSGVKLLDENNAGYRIFSAKDASNNKQLRLFDIPSGKGVFLNGGDSHKPYYWDGVSASSRLLDTSDKTALETVLAGKANVDFSNINTTGKNTMISWCMPDYSQGATFTLDSNTSYTALKDGFVFIYTSRAQDLMSNVKINGVQVGYSQAYWGNIQYFFPVSAGDVISTDYDSIQNALFCPLKGA